MATSRSMPLLRLLWAGGHRGDYASVVTDQEKSQPASPVYEFIPNLGRLRDDVLFGDVWEGTDLTKRDRSLVTVAVLAALYRTDELKGHMRRALDNGVTEEELKGLITHIAFYAGWPNAVNAGRVALEVFGPK
jgi:4-carboxymuconolactone decarboxylase